MILLVGCCFFFKQKTAYEMRISDWSSDVCSSDLMAAIKPIRTEADYEAALARAGTLMDAESGTPEGEELDVLVDLIEHYEAKHVPTGYPSPQIGRASCRERVCQ